MSFEFKITLNEFIKNYSRIPLSVPDAFLTTLNCRLLQLQQQQQPPPPLLPPQHQPKLRLHLLLQQLVREPPQLQQKRLLPPVATRVIVRMAAPV